MKYNNSMYPAQTSFIPLQVALARFLESNGLGATLGEYPYWYLGVPFRYLSGPILAPLLVILHRFFPSFSLFEIFFLLIMVGFLLGAVGLYWLVKELGGEKRTFAVVFHDYLAAIITILWLFFFWWFSYSFVLETKEEGSRTK